MKPEEDQALQRLINSLPADMKNEVSQLVKIWYKNGFNDGFKDGLEAGKNR